MPDGVSFRIVTEPFMSGLRQREARMPRAAMWAVREAGRVGKKAARQKAPVLKDSRYSKVSAQRKAGRSVRGSFDEPVSGLLRASITPSKNVKRLGGVVSLKVGPRGARVHLYAGKIEEKAGYMAAGEAAAAAALPAIAERSFNKVWKG